MEERYSTEKLLILRKLTRTVSDLLRGQMKEYLATLLPLLRPKAALGDYVRGGPKESPKIMDKAFKDVLALYESVGGASPFRLVNEVVKPIDLVSTTLEITPFEYTHIAKTESEMKTVAITSPLRWILNYSGFSVDQFRNLVRDRDRSADTLYDFVMHYIVLHVVVTNLTGINHIMDALHFPIEAVRLQGLGDLPVTCITCPISTSRPPDDVIVESTETTGLDAFEEIINVNDILKMRNPLKDTLIELVRKHGVKILA